MRSSLLTTIVVAAISLTLSACGKPTAPESPDPEAYGTKKIRKNQHLKNWKNNYLINNPRNSRSNDWRIYHEYCK